MTRHLEGRAGDGGEVLHIVLATWVVEQRPDMWWTRELALLKSKMLSHVLHSGPTPGRTWHSMVGLTAVSVRGKTGRISGVPRIDFDSNLVSSTH